MSSSSTFQSLGLPENLLNTISSIGYEQPSAIQEQSIPHLLNGKDLLGVAQTGTGKTAAFALPTLANLDIAVKQPQVLVLTPTRELAIQVAEAFKTYSRDLAGFHVLPIYGGQNMSTQLKQLQRGVQVVVGTPGRIMDHLRRKSLKLDALQTIVLDEADEMLRMGFIDDVEWILEHTPEQKQVALFSATMPKPIKKVADNYLNNPEEVRIQSKTTTVERIEQHCWTVSGTNKLDALTRILEVEEFDGIIIFVRTKTSTVELADKLEARGYSASAINGDMSQQLRERTIENLKKSKVDILVATDVAARGIDVARVSHVINYDIPYDTEAYVHRIGRTGRAGRSGKAILFVAPRERRLLKAIEKATGQDIIRMELPSREEVNEKRIFQFKQTILEKLGVPATDVDIDDENILIDTESGSSQNNDYLELEFFNQLIEELLQASGASEKQLAATLAWMAQKDNPIILPEERRKKRESRGLQRNNDDWLDEEKIANTDAGSREKYKMETWRLAVGYQHNVKPGDIVGAIANEAGIESRFIGQIEILEDHCYVDLPADMPEEVFQHLRGITIRSEDIKLERASKRAARSPSRPRKRSSDGKNPKRNSGNTKKENFKRTSGKKQADSRQANKKKTDKPGASRSTSKAKAKAEKSASSPRKKSPAKKRSPSRRPTKKI